MESAGQCNCRGEFVLGIRKGDFVFAFFRDPEGRPKNQIKAFRADAAEVPGIGDTIRDADALRGVRLERVWCKNLPEEMQEAFCRCAAVKSMKDLIWAPGQEPTPELQVA